MTSLDTELVNSFVPGLSAGLSRTDRGNGPSTCRRRCNFSHRRKRAGRNKHRRRAERATEAAGGPEHKPGEDTGAREGGHADRCQGRTFLKTAAGGHSAGTDTSPVSLRAEEERIGSSSSGEKEEETDGQPKRKRRRESSNEEDKALGPPESDKSTDPPPASSPSDRAKSETPSVESRDRA